VPEGYQPTDAIAGERMAAVENLGRIVKVTFRTSVSGVVEWSDGFVRKGEKGDFALGLIFSGFRSGWSG
jgi:hypothetical protein